MRFGRSVLLGGLLLLAPACTRPATPKSLPQEAVPTSDLVRVGTIGDAPRDCVEVGLAADGRIVTASGAVDLRSLRAHLAAESMGRQDPVGDSLRDVVLRVHPSLPWEVVLWTLGVCEGPRVRAYRIHFAVRPEQGEDEGTMAVFLFKRPPLDATPELQRRRTFRIRLLAHEVAFDDGTAFAAYREICSAHPDAAAEVLVRPGIAAGHVLRTADLLMRAGAKEVYFSGSLPEVPYTRSAGSRAGQTALEGYVAAHPANAKGFKVRVDVGTSTDVRDLVGGGVPAAAPPPVARVRGRPAGSVEAPISWAKSAIGLGGGGGMWRLGRKEDLAARGGSDLTEAAVELGLEWLADHQDLDDDGRWDCDDFMRYDPPDDRCDGPGHALHDVGVTGLAVLAFLGAGYTSRDDEKENKYTKNVRAGLRYLLKSQDDDGVFGTRAAHDFMYGHAIATLAMCEAFWMTRNPRYKKPAQDGLDFIAMARNPYLAWRYVPRGGENDTSVTAWCVMALTSGGYAGLDVDPDAFEGARQWIAHVTDPNDGQVGYNQQGGAPARPAGKQDWYPAEKSHSMTAAGMLCRVILGEDPKTSDAIRKGAALCVGRPPTWNPDDGSIDMYYWFFGTLALFQVGGDDWKAWNEAMKKAIVEHQHPKGAGVRAGSWDPIDAWGEEGGRVYSTALLVLCLEVYYRYGR